MRWPGRSSREAPEAAPTSAAAPPSTSTVSSGVVTPLDFRDGNAELLKRGIASQVIAEHRRELRRLNSEIARLSVSTTTTGSLVEELAADLNRELERLRAESVAWAEGPADRRVAGDAVRDA